MRIIKKKEKKCWQDRKKVPKKIQYTKTILKQTSQNMNTENKQHAQWARFDQLKPAKSTAQAAKSIIQPNPPAQRWQWQVSTLRLVSGKHPIALVCALLSLSWMCRSTCVCVCVWKLIRWRWRKCCSAVVLMCLFMLKLILSSLLAKFVVVFVLASKVFIANVCTHTLTHTRTHTFVRYVSAL